MTTVLLVDGVGRSVLYSRTDDVLTIVIGHDRFGKVKEMHEVNGQMLEVYRLQGCGRPTIRQVNHRLATDA